MSHGPKSKEWKDFKRNRHGKTHIKRCESGYQTKGLCEIHHLLCVHSCSDAEIEEESKQYIYDCMAITTWDINDAHNTIGLPKKNAYVDGAKDAPWNGLPCHMVDHNPVHTTEVVNWVKTNIWTKLKSAKNGERCEEVEQKRIHDMFKNGSDFFRTTLVDVRGKRQSGTKHVLDRGLEAEKWYEPFSMAEFPAPRPRPRDVDATLEKFLKEIF